MLQKLKDWLVDLLGGYPHSEIKVQRIILDEVYKREQELKKKLELIEEDLKNSNDNNQIEGLARILTISLENIRLKKTFGVVDDYKLEENIFSISREFKSLLDRKKLREWNKAVNFLEITPYQNQFLNKYDFFKTIEWKRIEGRQIEQGNNQLKKAINEQSK